MLDYDDDFWWEDDVHTLLEEYVFECFPAGEEELARKDALRHMSCDEELGWEGFYE